LEDELVPDEVFLFEEELLPVDVFLFEDDEAPDPDEVDDEPEPALEPPPEEVCGAAATLTVTVQELLDHWRSDAVSVMVAVPALLPVTTSVLPLT
jgi:hypothetical protein